MQIIPSATATLILTIFFDLISSFLNPQLIFCCFADWISVIEHALAV